MNEYTIISITRAVSIILLAGMCLWSCNKESEGRHDCVATASASGWTAQEAANACR